MIDWTKVNWETVSEGILFLAASILSALGVREGVKRMRAAPDDKQVELVGAVGGFADARTLKEMLAALEMQTVAIARQTVAANRTADATERLASAMDRSHENTQRALEVIGRLHDKLDDLKTEIIRGGR